MYDDTVPVISDSSFSSGSDRKYTVFIANNYGRGEVDADGNRIEQEVDGIILIRSVGESSHNTRRILEQKIFLQEKLVTATSDMKGGGPGGLTAQ